MMNWQQKELIDFAVWYSGMEREKVVKAYRRYLKEQLNLDEKVIQENIKTLEICQKKK